MKRITDYIEGLRTYKIPERYGWDAKIGIRFNDLQFTNICDCLHKQYGNQIEPFPLDFNIKLFNKAQVKRKIVCYIDINPRNIIVAQKYLDKSHLLSLFKDKDCFDPIDVLKCGDYTIVKNGHHRLAYSYLKGHRIVARMGIME